MIDRALPRRRTWLQPGRLIPLSLAGLAAAASALLVTSGSAAAPTECPTENRPNMLAIAAGSPQTAQLEKEFETNLQVALANSNGCPLTGQVAGIRIDFSAPASGASGTFARSGTNRVSVGTDETGVAKAPPFTANGTAGSYSVQADSEYGSVTLQLTNTASGVPASIRASGRTAQTARVNQPYQQPLRVEVLDANGRPVQGARVTFSLGTGSTGTESAGAGASFVDGAAQATATTKADGQATSPPFIANGSPGRFTATAWTEDVPTAVTFSLANHAGGMRIKAVPGARTAVVDSRYRRPLRARVLDSSGQPIEGVTVTFTLPQAASGAGASFPGGATEATRLTGANGRASSPPLLANGTAGRFTASAAVTGIAKSVSYALRNLAGRPEAISAGAASGQSAPAGSRFPIRLAVTVTDANDNPVSGVLVTFTAPARGPSGSFTSRPRGRPSPRRTVRAETNDEGVAIAPPFTANRRIGGYIVTARLARSQKRAAFALVNRARR